ncbi:hypothetical protein HELRODRAFT_64498 [Helobdella robusta]|uniref:Large ribosomal subunit protein uL15m n=1 Tax=Helobdella robusta TaxID=6412 RepID=T1FXV5_HELRO|nr:hypothetical protein HELRODRAFT_64498 [Helobdella robusta]ESO06122.1 hypothetical protein HELRODRAFT_64498 [Helobdella robusta]
MLEKGIEAARALIKHLPRVSLGNIRPFRPTPTRKHRLGKHGGRKCGRGNKGQGQRNTLPPIGFEGGNTPFHILIPKEPYYKGLHMMKEYPTLSLSSLQRLIDVNRLNANEFIDLTTISNTKVLNIDPSKNHYGINLTDEGVDCFKARVNIEVQWISEMAIAAIEKNGGVVTSRFYDMKCVEAMVDPITFFKRGLSIPRCKLPPQDLVEYYTNPANRGYLADPKLIEKARFDLSQKYGYKLIDAVDINSNKKDPRQIWHGLQPGWVINLQEKCILKPKNADHLNYYFS